MRSTSATSATSAISFDVDVRTGYAPFTCTFTPYFTAPTTTADVLLTDIVNFAYDTVKELRWYWDYSRSSATPDDTVTLNYNTIEQCYNLPSITHEFRGYMGKTYDVKCVAVLDINAP